MWAWTKEDDGALLRTTVLASDTENNVKFDPSNHFELCTNGPKSVTFWNWSEVSSDV